MGRGCLAGPLVAAVVVLDKRIMLLKDSKVLSKIKREQFAEKIKSKSLSCGVGWAWPKEIDELGLTEANRLAMSRALEKLSCDYDELIIDGSINYLSNFKNSVAIVKADVKIKAVSAASILAKVERDKYMYQLAKKYSRYGFERHVGYGTKLHLERIRIYGPCDQHRKSFSPIKEMVESLIT